MSALLEVRGVTAFYGQAQALFGVDLTVQAGQVVALLGRNGMGKTTTIRTICRLMRNRGGTVHFSGQDLTKLPPHKAARLGLGLVPEGRRCFAPLTVWENLVAGARPDPEGGGWDWESVTALFPRLAERRDQTAGTLSGGEQQMLAIARALARDIKVLLLDEPYEGLAPVIVDEIEKTLRIIKEQGITTVIVEQNAVRALELADRAVILDTGGIVFDGAAPEVLGDEALRAEYLAI